MPLTTESQQSTTLNAKIYSLLRSAILSGHLPAGQLLLETHVANLVGSSRVPIRQALAQLHTEGLLSRFDGRGFVVGQNRDAVIRAPVTAAALGLGDAEPGGLKERASESIYDAVERQLIISSVFGRVRVNEQELAAHHKVSRTVAHDVLLLAQLNGIVLKDERSRWYSVPLDEDRIGCLYELREQLEPLALAKAATAIPAEELVAVADRLTRAMVLYPNVSAAALDTLETDLHVDCLSHCPNPELIEALKRTRCILIFGKHILGSEVAYPPEEPFLSEHRRIIDAMLARDTAAVAQATLEHLRQARPKVLDRIRHFRSASRPPDLPYLK